MNKKKRSTSWEGVSRWYNKSVGASGHYYHENVVLPKVLTLLKEEGAIEGPLLDLACGQGILSRHLPEDLDYLGVDLAPSLISAARKGNTREGHKFTHGDITEPLKAPKEAFKLCTCLLALQNLQEPAKAIQNAFDHLSSGGRFVAVINHPCFRIPRQSSWGHDEEKKIQYRRIDRYTSSLSIPITASPSKGARSETTLSFHHPLEAWMNWLKKAGFYLETLEEWCSDKTSTGGRARQENRARREIPLFLAFVARKL